MGEVPKPSTLKQELTECKSGIAKAAWAKADVYFSLSCPLSKLCSDIAWERVPACYWETLANSVHKPSHKTNRGLKTDSVTQELTECKSGIAKAAGAKADNYYSHGDTIPFGSHSLEVHHTFQS